MRKETNVCFVLFFGLRWLKQKKIEKKENIYQQKKMKIY